MIRDELGREQIVGKKGEAFLQLEVSTFKLPKIWGKQMLSLSSAEARQRKTSERESTRDGNSRVGNLKELASIPSLEAVQPKALSFGIIRLSFRPRCE